MEHAINPITKTGALLAAIFVALVWLLPNGAIHEVLNGVFVAMATVVALVFRRITIDTVLGRGEYKRAQRMALGLALLWLAFNIRAAQSILFRATDNASWVLDLPTGALITYLAIISGWLQITSPGFKMQPGYLHGQSQAWIAFAVLLGLTVGTGVIWLQRGSMLLSVL